MQFGNPRAFLLFWILPAFLLFYILVFRKRKRALETFAGKVLYTKLLVGVSSFKRGLKATLILFSVLFMILALAEPKWGFEVQEIKRRGTDVVVALDVSKSMLAEDVKPNRLSRAKLEIENLFSELTGDRVALVPFAGSSFIQCPLTVDYATAKLFLDDVNVTSIPRGGTDIGGAIHKAIEAFEAGGEGGRVILLVTDGEDHGKALEGPLKEAKEKGITIYPIGIGRPEGAPIPSPEAEGKTEYVRSREGTVILSRLDPKLLEQIAASTGGKGGVIGSGDFSLEDLYTHEIARLDKIERETQQKKEYHHRFQWPLSVAIALLFLEGVLRERK
ncbi:MAG: VWA domain-containing protein [Candidatus Omnitrophica bacterium]|nr:VWA domain-containing protein [Candidatus Omnitrophota bacterium]